MRSDASAAVLMARSRPPTRSATSFLTGSPFRFVGGIRSGTRIGKQIQTTCDQRDQDRSPSHACAARRSRATRPTDPHAPHGAGPKPSTARVALFHPRACQCDRTRQDSSGVDDARSLCPKAWSSRTRLAAALDTRTVLSRAMPPNRLGKIATRAVHPRATLARNATTKKCLHPAPMPPPCHLSSTRGTSHHAG
jgi:hypothetical protein